MDQQSALSGLIGGLAGGAAMFMLLQARNPTSASRAIRRLHTSDPRASGIVIHNNYVHISGQVGNLEALESSDIKAQTKQTLLKIDNLLADAGTNKSNLL